MFETQNFVFLISEWVLMDPFPFRLYISPIQEDIVVYSALGNYEPALESKEEQSIIRRVEREVNGGLLTVKGWSGE
jgi:hypothetical protein